MGAPFRHVVAMLLGLCLLPGAATAAVFTGIEYGSDDDRALLLDVRTPSKPGPFRVWVEWVERDASPLIVPDREIRAADTVLVRAVMPARRAARKAAAADLLRWLATSLSGYGGDRERVALISGRGGAQPLLDLWQSGPAVATDDLPRSVRALILVAPPATLRGHRDWPDLPLLLIDAPANSGSLWRTALALRNQGIAAEPVVLQDVGSGLSAQVAAMLAAGDVPRVQRFDQMAIDAPIAVEGRLLDALRHGDSLLALLWDGQGPVARLVSFDARGAAKEVRRWPWRDDARIAALDGGLVAMGSDAEGRPHLEWSAQATGDWHALPASMPAAPVRLAATAQRGGDELALAWTRAAAQSAARSSLQRIAAGSASGMGASAPRLVGSRAVAGRVRALAFAEGDLFVARAGPYRMGANRIPLASLLRWRAADRSPTPVVDARDSPWQALFGLSPSGAKGANSAALLGLREGRLYAIDPGCTPICLREELDYHSLVAVPSPLVEATAAGMADSVSRQGAPTAQWLRHPETGESLLALMPPSSGGARDSRPARSAWLIRQSSGRYGFAQLPVDRASATPVLPRAVQPWPSGTEPNRFALFGGNRDRSWLFAAHLQRTGVTPGLWWDPARSGHGFDLRRAGSGWQVTIYTFDERGAPLWLRGEGEFRDGRWRAGNEGLLRYRILPGSSRVEIDRRSVQSLEVELQAAGNDGGCPAAERDHEASVARATLSQGEASSVFCIEPLRLAATGRPQVDIDGIWSARDEPAPWQLALTTQGEDPRARISAMLTYFDRSGAPRWAYAASDWRGGAADLPLFAVRGACTQCAGQPFHSRAIGQLSLRGSGECGAARVTASLRVAGASGAIGVPPGIVGLAPGALLGCY